MSVENEWGRAGWRGVVWRDSGFSAETQLPTSRSPFESPWVLGAGSHRIASTLNFRVMCVRNHPGPSA